MQLFLITIFLLVIHQYHCHSTTGSVSLRDKWKNQIKIGLNDGKRIVGILNSERKSAILNQIHLLTNFIGAVDSLAVFIMDFNPKTEQKYFKDIKSIFTEINRKLELTTDAKFGRDFREIFFELRSMDFSFMLLNRYLEKMDGLKCTSLSECKEKIQWTAEIFRNDFDIADDYSHILRATLNGTRFSDISIVRQVKTSSRCDEQIMLNFGVNLLLKFFKAKQVTIVYQKLSQPNVSSIANIQEWANDMYVFRKHLFQAMQECFSKNICKADCGKGKCILLPKIKQDICNCPEFYDGHQCQIHNQVNSAIDIVSIISLLKRVPKLDPIIDRRMITNYLSTSLKCVPDALEIVQNFNIHKIKENILTIADLGPFYNTYLAMKFYIKQAMNALKCQSFKGATHKRTVLSRVAVNLNRVLFKIDAYINYRQNDDTFQPESLLTAVINRNRAEACTGNYKTKINTLWRKFHIAQSHGFSVLLMVNHVLGKSTVPVVRLYKDRLKNQVQYVSDSSCGAMIAHSSNVKCEYFHLGKSTRIENKCLKGYKREGTQYITCDRITSSCTPCSCSSIGSYTNSTCDENSGQCLCKENFTGLKCEKELDQDCKWSDWTSWSSCNRVCGMGGMQIQSRHVAVKQLGNGKTCKGPSRETRQCFNKCCDGTFHCTDSNRCLTGIQCQPCNCHYPGSRSGKCSWKGTCTCKRAYYGRKCSYDQ